jgi:hypothetical protein
MYQLGKNQLLQAQIAQGKGLMYTRPYTIYGIITIGEAA